MPIRADLGVRFSDAIGMVGQFLNKRFVGSAVATTWGRCASSLIRFSITGKVRLGGAATAFRRDAGS